jgi:radical SAM family uncharacterized protein/radical SAM-linked protein
MKQMIDINKILPFVQKPSRYLGDEFNAIHKDWQQAAVRSVLVFPDLYEVGMSHQGLHILYHIINNHSDYLAERAYAPDVDLEEQLRKHHLPLFSLESQRSLADFDLIGITLPYELCSTNILTVLDLAGLPLKAVDRTDDHPLVLGGGSGSFNPEPVADFFDAVLLGDGEEAVLEILDLLKRAKEKGASRSETLAMLAGINGIYIPSFFEPRYDDAGRIKEIVPLHKGYTKVRRRVLADLEQASAPIPPLVPLGRIVHDRLSLEIARGCTRGCRFCQAGIIYRPVRERSADRLMEIACEGIEKSGFDEVSLLSLSTGDYSCLPDLLGRLMNRFAEQRISVAMPSMRVGTLTAEMMEQIRKVRKTGFTVAPEAGTDRLRQVINKGITEEDLLATCRDAFSLGWKQVKFYFMFGLPTETDEDVIAIAKLAEKAVATAGRPGCQVTVSVATFAPKPHTPFQWERQITIEEGFAKLRLIKENLPRRGVKVRWHDPRLSFMEGVLSRGDRRLAAVIMKAWQSGARLDGWDEHYDLNQWLEASKQCDIDLEQYLRARDHDEILPWDHLSVGLDAGFLEKEYQRALKKEYTPDCRVHGCHKCGICDFKNLRPISGRKKDAEPAPGDIRTKRTDGGDEHFYYRIHYSRLGKSRFLGHLELLQFFFRVFQRVALPIHFSQGFNPSPKVSFGPALPVGTESMVEYLDVDLHHRLDDIDNWIRRINDQLFEGLEVYKISQLPVSGQPGAVVSTFHIQLPEESRLATGDIQGAIEGFMESPQYQISRVRKGKKRTIDIRPLVRHLTSEDGIVILELLSEPGKAGCRPMDVVSEVLKLSEQDVPAVRIRKVKWERI